MKNLGGLNAVVGTGGLTCPLLSENFKNMVVREGQREPAACTSEEMREFTDLWWY